MWLLTLIDHLLIYYIVILVNLKELLHLILILKKGNSNLKEIVLIINSILLVTLIKKITQIK